VGRNRRLFFALSGIVVSILGCVCALSGASILLADQSKDFLTIGGIFILAGLALLVLGVLGIRGRRAPSIGTATALHGGLAPPGTVPQEALSTFEEATVKHAASPQLLPVLHAMNGELTSAFPVSQEGTSMQPVSRRKYQRWHTYMLIVNQSSLAPGIFGTDWEAETRKGKLKGDAVWDYVNEAGEEGWELVSVVPLLRPSTVANHGSITGGSVSGLSVLFRNRIVGILSPSDIACRRLRSCPRRNETGGRCLTTRWSGRSLSAISCTM